MLRGTCYRDMSETDPDFPEQFRAGTTSPNDSLQQDSSFILDSNNFQSQDQEQNQPMSEDGPADWAEEMQRDSAEKLAAQNVQGKVKI